MPMPCGRLDEHDRHEWTRPRLLTVPPRTYACEGHRVVEGGHYWSAWDAEDDRREREAELRREGAS